MFHPGACAVNLRKKVRVKHTGSFDDKGLSEFARNLAAGRGGRNLQGFNELASLAVVEPWDGQDATPEVVDDDLGDFSWDDEEEEDDNAKDEL